MGKQRLGPQVSWQESLEKVVTGQFALDVGRHVSIGAVNQAFNVVGKFSQRFNGCRCRLHSSERIKLAAVHEPNRLFRAPTSASLSSLCSELNSCRLDKSIASEAP